MRVSNMIMVLAVLATAAWANAATAAQATVDARRDGGTVVSAPGTRVAVLPKRTKVRVQAPSTAVKVDTAARHVRVRVPYYSGDISW